MISVFVISYKAPNATAEAVKPAKETEPESPAETLEAENKSDDDEEAEKATPAIETTPAPQPETPESKPVESDEVKGDKEEEEKKPTNDESTMVPSESAEVAPEPVKDET